MSTVEEIKAAISTLSGAERAELDQWYLCTYPDSALRAELLKAVKRPHKPFSEMERRGIADRALRDLSVKSHG